MTNAARERDPSVFYRPVHRVNFILVLNIRNIIVEVRRRVDSFASRSSRRRLACGHVFCDTCTSHRRVVPWIDSEQRVRVCNTCYGQTKSRPILPSSTSIDIEKRSRTQKHSPEQAGSSGESTSTVSSGEHLNDLCLSPTDIFDIEQPSAGPAIVDIPTTRRVYETVKSGLEKIGVHYPIGENFPSGERFHRLSSFRIDQGEHSAELLAAGLGMYSVLYL